MIFFTKLKNVVYQLYNSVIYQSHIMGLMKYKKHQYAATYRTNSSQFINIIFFEWSK
jgi:exopolysaccharide biosynthesis protein